MTAVPAFAKPRIAATISGPLMKISSCEVASNE